jgi:hypothetical protein
MSEMEEMRGELEALTSRVRRLERRLNDLEPETQPGVGREPAPEYSEPPQDSGSPILDMLGEAIGALGGFARERD